MQSLLGFLGVTLGHVTYIGLHRVLSVLLSKRKANTFAKSRQESDETFYGRVCQSHMNCLENLPLLAIVVFAHRLVEGNTQAIDGMASLYLKARIAQVIVHVATRQTHEVVLARATCFFAQVFLVCAMGWKTYKAAM